MLTDEQRKQLEEAQSVSFTESKWVQNLMKSMTRSKSIEQEADVMLDHDYDGIKELDQRFTALVGEFILCNNYFRGNLFGAIPHSWRLQPRPRV